MNYQDYIEAELLILVPVLYFVGIALKKSKLPDKWIPLVIGIAAVVLSAIWTVATNSIASIKEAAYAVFTSITQGVLVAGASVYASQLYIQAKKEE